MKNFSYIKFIAILLTISCSKSKLKNDFLYLDYSSQGSFGENYSVKLDSSGHFSIRTNFYFDSIKNYYETDSINYYYEGVLSDSIKNKIIVFADSAFTSKADTLSRRHVLDGGIYKLIIRKLNGRKTYRMAGTVQSQIKELSIALNHLIVSETKITSTKQPFFESLPVYDTIFIDFLNRVSRSAHYPYTLIKTSR